VFVLWPNRFNGSPTAPKPWKRLSGHEGKYGDVCTYPHHHLEGVWKSEFVRSSRGKAAQLSREICSLGISEPPDVGCWGVAVGCPAIRGERGLLAPGRSAHQTIFHRVTNDFGVVGQFQLEEDVLSVGAVGLMLKESSPAMSLIRLLRAINSMTSSSRSESVWCACLSTWKLVISATPRPATPVFPRPSRDRRGPA
jgi:hypothetical protein